MAEIVSFAARERRERRAARGWGNQLDRAVSDVLLRLDHLSIEEQLVVLHEALQEQLGKPHRTIYVRQLPAADRPAAAPAARSRRAAAPQ